MGVDLLMDTRSTYNLMSTALCKKLNLVVMPNTKTLVSFSGIASQIVGVTHAETKLREYSKKLQFHVTAGRVQPIQGYSEMKELNMGVNCAEDCLVSGDGRKMLFHRVRVKEEERNVAYEHKYVQITQIKNAKGSKVLKKSFKLLIPAEAPIVLGP